MDFFLNKGKEKDFLLRQNDESIMPNGVGRVFTCYFFYILFAMLRSIQSFRMRPLSALRVHKPSSRTLSAHTDKPNFRNEFDSKYFDFQRAEANIYKWWENSGYFKPKLSDNARKFVMSMPPPNVTGYLHMGHAIFIALQDIMARFHRMKGVETLWLPGTDHAGIATQMLVEKALAEKGISRVDLGREEFLSRVWIWKEEKGGYITQQMKRLGASADWSREKFTLDPDMCEAVTTAFIQLYDKGLIYRGNYMVNWSPKLQTAVSDLEVDYVEEEGKLYYFKYMTEDGREYIPVATTRPETILGDTAVCVHPDDTRYKHLIGSTVVVPLFGRVIPVIADEYVDREFGTGALKITPAHDVNDYALGKKHSLPLINMMNKNATINEIGGPEFQGLDRFECRTKLWNRMKELELTIKEVAHLQRVPRSQRSGEIIEPMISSQWFVKMDSMAKKAIEKVQTKELQIIPERFDKVWYNWLENIHDWCISRQLWWGHRIPVYYVVDESSKTIIEDQFIIARSLEEAHEKANLKFQRPVTLQQDEDVLDTWFSSGLWPFSTVGWPHAVHHPDQYPSKVQEFSRYYPGSVLETGYDILFFWVARMVTMGLELTNQLPFHTIYLHGLIRDAQGQKMSKTKGNVIDPIDTISSFGSDALRYTLVTSATPGQDVSLAMEKIEFTRNFVNKLWNIGKYIDHCATQLTQQQYAGDRARLHDALRAHSIVDQVTSNVQLWDHLHVSERYILSKHHELIQLVNELLSNHQFAESGKLINDFLWNEFADWYLEVSKTHLRAGSLDQQLRTLSILYYIWDHSLRLLHPYMPYVTEILFQQIPAHQSQQSKHESIIIAPFPQPSSSPDSHLSNAELLVSSNGDLMMDAGSVNTFQKFQEMIKQIRNVRVEYHVDVNKKLPIIIKVNQQADMTSQLRMLKALLQEKAGLALLCKVDDDNISVIFPHDTTTTHLVGNEAADSIMNAVKMISESAVSSPSASNQLIHLIIDEDIELYIPQSELIDKEKELHRLKKQLEKVQKEIDGLEKRLSNDSFRLKAPEALVQETKAKVQEFVQQKVAIEKSVNQLHAT